MNLRRQCDPACSGDSLDLRAANNTIRLSDRERRKVHLLIEIGKGVIDEAVSCFVCADCANDIDHLGIGLETPVVLVCELESYSGLSLTMAILGAALSDHSGM